ncbi:MAG: TetR/AcrR family transcriptional regulator [Myxococcota bacterium]
MKARTDYHHGDLKNALLRAGEEELAEKGVEAFSLRSVAKRAGVSHGAPAYHFGDVPGLLTALAAMAYRRFIATQEQFQARYPADPKSQLAASGLGYIHFAESNPSLFRLIFASDRPNRSAPELSAAADAAFDKLLVDVAQLLERDPSEDPAAMSRVMSAWVVAHGIADLMLTGRFDRMPFFAHLSAEGRDALFAELILRGVDVP